MVSAPSKHDWKHVLSIKAIKTWPHPTPQKNQKKPQKQKDQTNKQKQKTIQEINNIFLSLLGNLKVLYQKTKLMFCVFIAIF